MNLALMREDNITATLVSAIGTFKSDNYRDQDIINKVCYGRILHLPLKYNVMTDFVVFEPQKTSLVFPNYEIEEAKKTPVILHFAGIKPWESLHGLFLHSWYKNALECPSAENYVMSLVAKNNESNYKMRALEQEIRELKIMVNSTIFRVGTIVTFIPRAIKIFAQKILKRGVSQ